MAFSPCALGDPVFLEKKGVIAMEAESTASRLRKWTKKTDVPGFMGECHLEFTGNKAESGPPDSPLKYVFKVNKPGVYQLVLRARKRLETKREDISNDCYVSLDGDFESGGEAPLKVLREDNKLFGGSAEEWGWATQLDVQGKKYPALYRIQAGEEYELTISGRSKNFNIDRILLIHEAEDLRQIQRDNPSESQREGAGANTSKLPPKVMRKLKNVDGKVIEAELLGKTEETVAILVHGKRFEIPITSLSEADQEFINEWQP